MKVKVTATPEQLKSIGIDDHSIIGQIGDATYNRNDKYIVFIKNTPWYINEQWLTEVKDKT